MEIEGSLVFSFEVLDVMFSNRPLTANDHFSFTVNQENITRIFILRKMTQF